MTEIVTKQMTKTMVCTPSHDIVHNLCQCVYCLDGSGDSTTSQSEDETSTSDSPSRIGINAGCQEDLVCTLVSSNRSECQSKNSNGTLMTLTLILAGLYMQ